MSRIRITQFHNGQSKYETIGYPGQYLRSQGLNRSQFNVLQLNYGLSRATGDGTTVTPSNMYADTSGIVYFLDFTNASKRLIKFDPSAPTLFSVLNGAIGTGATNGIFKWNNRIYYCVSTALRYYDLNATTDNAYQTLGSSNAMVAFPKSGKMYLTTGNTLSSIDTSNTFTATELTLPTGYTAVDLCEWQEYLVILCKKPDGTGALIYWALDSTTSWDFVAPLPDIPQIVWNTDGDVRVMIGNNLSIYKVQRTFSIIHLDYEYTVDPTLPIGATWGYTVSPAVKTSIGNLVYFGVVQNNNSNANTNILSGIYSYGTKDPKVPGSINCEYIISTGNNGNTITLNGLAYSVTNSQQYMYVGWQDTLNTPTSGLDQLSSSYGSGSSTNPPFYESLVFDGDNPEVLKLWNYFAIGIKSLDASTVVTVQMKFDDGTWTTIANPQGLKTAPTGTATTLVEYPIITGALARRCQFRVKLDNSANRTKNPQVTSFILGYGPGQSRQDRQSVQLPTLGV